MVLVINVGGDLVVSYLVISCVMSCDDGVWSVGVVAWDFQSSLQISNPFTFLLSHFQNSLFTRAVLKCLVFRGYCGDDDVMMWSFILVLRVYINHKTV